MNKVDEVYLQEVLKNQVCADLLLPCIHVLYKNNFELIPRKRKRKFILCLLL